MTMRVIGREQIKRVPKSDGRLAVVSVSKENGESIFLRLYELTIS